MGEAKKYIIVAINRTTCKMNQASFTHTWDECESLYEEYREVYDDCEIIIMDKKEALDSYKIK